MINCEEQKKDMYDDYYGESVDEYSQRSVFKSQQKSLMIFLARSESALQKSEHLFAFNHVEIPDLQSFESLGFPLKQTLRVSLTDS